MISKTTSILTALAFGILLGGCSDKGRAVAFELDGKTVLAEERCGSKEYVACGQRVREQAKGVLCARGKGKHEYLYKISKGEPMKQTAFCN